MTEDITSLQIKILYDSVESAEKRLKTLEITGKQTEKSLGGISSGISGSLKSLYAFAAGAGVVTASIVALKAIVAKTAEFQKLNAMLETATGSAANAKQAFEALQDYAKETPSSLIEVTRAFIRLVSSGLTPSEKALRAYGDTAAGLGGKLEDVVEAVSKATVGEFEPLRKFYVNVKNHGDKVSFSFNNVTKTVANNKAAIEQYFIELGEKNFAGAMAKQMNTLNGQLSNLGDAWDTLLNNIGTNGLGDVVSSVLTGIGKSLDDLNAKFKSGEMQASLDSWAIGWKELYLDGSKSISDLALVVEKETAKMDGTTDGWLTKFKKALQELPTNLKFHFGAAEVALRNSAIEAMQSELDDINKGAYTPQIRTGRFIWNHRDATAEETAARKKELEDQIKEATSFNELVAQQTLDSRQSTIDRIAALEEDARAASLVRISDYFDKVSEMEMKAAGTVAKTRKEVMAGSFFEGTNFGEITNEPPKGGDRTAQFKKPTPTGTEPPTTPTIPKKDPEDSQWETLKRQLENQEGLVQESYEKRLALIEKYTDDGSEYQVTLEVGLTKKIEEEGIARLEKQKEISENVFSIYQQEEDLITESYERRKQIILSSTQSTEDEKNKMLEESEKLYRARMEETSKAQVKEVTEALVGLLENMQTVSGAFGKKSFMVTKGLAMAEAAVKGPQAVLNAYTSGTSLGGPIVGSIFAAIAAAATAAQIAKISSQEYTGAYAIGGLIPPGKTGLVGEAGPELVKGPAMITSAQATWDRSGGAASSSGSNVEVNIVNNTGAEVTQNRRQEGDKQMVEFIIGRVRDGMATDIAKGGTRMSKAIEGTYNLSRGQRR